MTNQFHFELVSPEQKLLSEEAFQVTIPGEEGDVGVRAGHMALVMTVRPGVVEVVRTEGGETEKIFVAGGFADISQTHCTLLAEQAVPLVSLIPDKLTAEVQTLQEQLAMADTPDERNAVNRKLSMVYAMLDAVKVA